MKIETNDYTVICRTHAGIFELRIAGHPAEEVIDLKADSIDQALRHAEENWGVGGRWTVTGTMAAQVRR